MPAGFNRRVYTQTKAVYHELEDQPCVSTGKPCPGTREADVIRFGLATERTKKRLSSLILLLLTFLRPFFFYFVPIHLSLSLSLLSFVCPCLATSTFAYIQGTKRPRVEKQFLPVLSSSRLNCSNCESIVSLVPLNFVDSPTVLGVRITFQISQRDL